MSTQYEINIDGFLKNIIISYEERIQKIQTAFQSSEHLTESSRSLFEHVHNSLNDLKKERHILNARICETLAKNRSLRKKDYNAIMSRILSTLDEKEKEAEQQFKDFIEYQKETARSLKKTLLGIKNITSSEAGEKITLIKGQLSQISKQQEMRKEMVMKTFVDFQQMHNRTIKYLESILEKGEHIQVQDLKKIKTQLFEKIVLIGRRKDLLKNQEEQNWEKQMTCKSS